MVGKGQTVLVVDDEECVCQGCRRALVKEGYRVDCSTDPVDALRLAESGRYDALLLAIKMRGMDGLSVLERLHRNRPSLPVVMITGYPSAESASASMRMGAHDYVCKPFTPRAITESLQRASRSDAPRLSGTAASDVLRARDPVRRRERARAALELAAWVPATEEVWFMGDSWVREGGDGSVLVGAFLPRYRVTPVESVKLPGLGETVHRGLPLASFAFAGLPTRRIPSPVTGRVVAVNLGLGGRTTGAFADPCLNLWVARIEPRDLGEDRRFWEVRRVLLASRDRRRGLEQERALSRLGCRVRTVSSASEALDQLEATGARVVFVDAASMGRRGLSLVKRVRRKHRDVMLVALVPHGSNHEEAYRDAGVSHYALDPLTAPGVQDIVYLAFFTLPSPARAEVIPDGSPTVIEELRVTNGHGTRVALHTLGTPLWAHEGLGLQVRQRLLAGAYPMEASLGPASRDPAEVSSVRRIIADAEECDRVVLLVARNTGGIPGSLRVDESADVVCVPEHAGARMTTLFVQPGPDDPPGGPFRFDARTMGALAEHIVREMTA